MHSMHKHFTKPHDRPLKVALAGTAGRVGQALATALLNDDRFEMVAVLLHGTSTPTHQNEGFQSVESHVNIDELLESRELDVLIDFTSHDAAFQNAKAALLYGVCVVIGATGLTDQEVKELNRIAQSMDCGVYLCGNVSNIFVNFLAALAKLCNQFSMIEICDRHQVSKGSAPSATAGEIAAWIKQIMDDSGIGTDAEGGEARPKLTMRSVRVPFKMDEHEVYMCDAHSSLRITYSVYDGWPFVERTLDAAVVATERTGVIDGAGESRIKALALGGRTCNGST